MNVTAVEQAIGYTFKDKSLLERALTLSSASCRNNEELEFLGDSVVQLVVSEELYRQGGNEGQLTDRRQAIVSKEGLEGVTKKFGFDAFLIYGKGDTKNKKAISSVYEALAGAIYLDGGYENAKSFVLRTADFAGEFAIVNYKGKLKERLEKRDGSFAIKQAYDDGEEMILNDQRVWKKTLTVDGRQFTATGATKDEAEQRCARQALDVIGAKR